MSRVDIPHPDSFKEGVRVLLLMLRAKDGGSAKTDRKATKKVVTQSPQEFDEALAELRSAWRPVERIYSTVVARNLNRAIRNFKYRQLDADFFAAVDRESFYLDLENRWISCLKDPSACAGTKAFLFDIDIDDQRYDPTTVRDELVALKVDAAQAPLVVGDSIVLDEYCTRNGKHIITLPFNPALLSPRVPRFCLHKNALMLWSY